MKPTTPETCRGWYNDRSGRRREACVDECTGQCTTRAIEDVRRIAELEKELAETKEELRIACDWLEPGVATGDKWAADCEKAWDRIAELTLRWRSEPPDEPGWWMFKDTIMGKEVRRALAFYPVSREGTLGAQSPPGRLWAGPIPEPEEG